MSVPWEWLEGKTFQPSTKHQFLMWTNDTLPDPLGTKLCKWASSFLFPPCKIYKPFTWEKPWIHCHRPLLHLLHLLGSERTYFWNIQIIPILSDLGWGEVGEAVFFTLSSSDFVFRTKTLRWKQIVYDCSGETCYIT